MAIPKTSYLCKMFQKNSTKRSIALLFSAMYLFVALFSQHFHQHGSGEIFKDFHFQKPEKTFTQSSGISAITDCLSCHVFHEGKFLIPQEYNFVLRVPQLPKQQFFSDQQQFSKVLYFSFQLRGPPSNFI